MSDEQHPGAILLERYLEPLGITTSELARSIKVPVRRVSELVRGHRSITPDMAARLALFFDVPPQWWLELQARFDAAHLRLEKLRDVVTPYEGLADVLVTPHGVERLAPADSARAAAPVATYSEDFLARLRAQAEWAAEEAPRSVSEKTFTDGTVALVGE